MKVKETYQINDTHQEFCQNRYKTFYLNKNYFHHQQSTKSCSLLMFGYETVLIYLYLFYHVSTHLYTFSYHSNTLYTVTYALIRFRFDCYTWNTIKYKKGHPCQQNNFDIKVVPIS